MKNKLTRLIKSDFFDTKVIIDGSEKYNIEIFKNPNIKEINEVKKSSLYDGEAIRGIIINNDIYIWDGNILHYDLKHPEINIDNGFRFGYYGEWELNNYPYSLEEIYKIIIKHKDTLQNIGDFNKLWSINFSDSEYSENFKNFTEWENEMKEKNTVNARLIKSEYDVGKRDGAILIINGSIYESNTHAEALTEYFKDHGIEELYEKYNRPRFRIDLKNVTNKNDYHDIKLMQDNINQIAFAHLVNAGDDDIVLETDSLFNITVNEAVNLLKNKFKGSKIYDDNKVNDFGGPMKIAKNTKVLRLIKSEFFNGYNFNNEYYECYKNPSAEEFKILRKNNGELRIQLLSDGTVYAWSGELWHSEQNFVNMYNGISLYTEDGILNIETDHTTKEELTKAFNNTKTLWNGINKSSNIEFYGSKFDQYHFTNIQEIINGEETEYNDIIKKLNKTSEFFNGYKPDDENYYEIFKNPTAKEVSIVRNKTHNAVRAILTQSGDIYTWDSEILHDEMISQNGVPDGVHLVIGQSGSCYIYLRAKDTLKKLQETFKNSIDKLNIFGTNNSSEVIVEYSFEPSVVLTHNDHIIFMSIKIIDDILNIDGLIENIDELKKEWEN